MNQAVEIPNGWTEIKIALNEWGKPDLVFLCLKAIRKEFEMGRIKIEDSRIISLAEAWGETKGVERQNVEEFGQSLKSKIDEFQSLANLICCGQHKPTYLSAAASIVHKISERSDENKTYLFDIINNYNEILNKEKLVAPVKLVKAGDEIDLSSYEGVKSALKDWNELAIVELCFTIVNEIAKTNEATREQYKLLALIACWIMKPTSKVILRIEKMTIQSDLETNMQGQKFSAFPKLAELVLSISEDGFSDKLDIAAKIIRSEISMAEGAEDFIRDCMSSYSDERLHTVAYNSAKIRIAMKVSELGICDADYPSIDGVDGKDNSKTVKIEIKKAESSVKNSEGDAATAQSSANAKNEDIHTTGNTTSFSEGYSISVSAEALEASQERIKKEFSSTPANSLVIPFVEEHIKCGEPAIPYPFAEMIKAWADAPNLLAVFFKKQNSKDCWAAIPEGHTPSWCVGRDYFVCNKSLKEQVLASLHGATLKIHINKDISMGGVKLVNVEWRRDDWYMNPHATAEITSWKSYRKIDSVYDITKDKEFFFKHSDGDYLQIKSEGDIVDALCRGNLYEFAEQINKES